MVGWKSLLMCDLFEPCAVLRDDAQLEQRQQLGHGAAGQPAQQRQHARLADVAPAARVRDAPAQHAGQGHGRRVLQPAHLRGAAHPEHGEPR
jgi:hypothetical protein